MNLYPEHSSNYWDEIIVGDVFPDAYRDVRGFELRFEKQMGRFITFNAMYDYMLQSGQTGLANI
jgi:hypothetical protein